MYRTQPLIFVMIMMALEICIMSDYIIILWIMAGMHFLACRSNKAGQP